jgi:hypothetical protein
MKIAILAGFDAAAGALRYVAPVSERDAYVRRVLDVVRPFVGTAVTA